MRKHKANSIFKIRHHPFLTRSRVHYAGKAPPLPLAQSFVMCSDEWSRGIDPQGNRHRPHEELLQLDPSLVGCGGCVQAAPLHIIKFRFRRLAKSDSILFCSSKRAGLSAPAPFQEPTMLKVSSARLAHYPHRDLIMWHRFLNSRHPSPSNNPALSPQRMLMAFSTAMNTVQCTCKTSWSLAIAITSHPATSTPPPYVVSNMYMYAYARTHSLTDNLNTLASKHPSRPQHARPVHHSCSMRGTCNGRRPECHAVQHAWQSHGYVANRPTSKPTRAGVLTAHCCVELRSFEFGRVLTRFACRV